MSYRDAWIPLIQRGARKRGLDPRAVLAVASAEGLSGGVGDNNTSFGPFQLHVGGALPRGRDRAWAESPAGIAYALDQIASVARGQTGRQAIESIVRRFERPADPGSEVARAAAAYGKFGGGTEAPGSAAPAPPGMQHAPGASVRDQALQQLASGGNLNFVSLLGAQQAQQQQQSSRMARTAGQPQQPMPQSGSAPRGALAEAFYDPLGSWDNGRFGGAIGHHSDHVHLSITNPRTMLAAIAQAQRMGLHVGENPYLDHVDPVHVKGSFHYRDFPGKYNGRTLGEAIDVSGSPKQMAGYYRWATTTLI